MTRVIAGSAGGRRLVVPRGRATRPTSDRAREGLFSSVASLRGPLAGVRFLDLYAGTGAVGIEALSRGAAHVCFVESDDVAAGVIRANLAALQLAGGVVRQERVERFVSALADESPYDLVFADPPYAEAAAHLAATISALAEQSLAPGAVIVVERAAKDPDWTWPEGISALQSRRYGDTTLWYGHKS
jgi:16S rRNA (guanine966-N2)-methyltransferase